MFVMPKSCEGGVFPPLDSRVVYQVVVDEKTGRPRAESVKLEGGAARHYPGAQWAGGHGAYPAAALLSHGHAAYPGAKGYAPYPGGKGHAAYPGAKGHAAYPAAKGHASYPGTKGHGAYSGARGHAALPALPGAKGGWGGRLSGTFISDQGNFGFIEQDSGGDNMFVMPKSFEGGVFPPIDTRVNYDVVLDSKTGRPRAEGVVPEQQSPWDPHQTYTGTVLERKSTDNFGFIEQDSGGDKMFCLPRSCAAWDNEIPPAGTRVQYRLVLDSKTGRPRAEDVQPLDDEVMAEETAAERVAAAGHLPYGWDAGVVSDITNPKFAFITPDTGGSNMFLLPRSCVGFDGVIPPLHTRVIYRVVVDSKTGRPRAEEVQKEGSRVKPVGKDPWKGGKGGKGGKDQEPGGPMLFGQKLYGPPALMSQTSRAAAAAAAAPGRTHAAQAEGPSWAGAGEQEFAGSIARISGSFGFIDQDCGGENMFVLPKACEAFGKEIPPVGTRVLYTVIADVKTGRPRADKVRPETAGWRPAPRPATKGTGKAGGEDYLAILAGRSTTAYGPASGPHGGKGRGLLVPKGPY
mmetsp:Transcript_7306/g.18982  ORF Transcript_7306/g.18982 Transcript_7306/m.18982 type:complete len:573 (-) Transcript_7306:117-1835(-)